MKVDRGKRPKTYRKRTRGKEKGKKFFYGNRKENDFYIFNQNLKFLKYSLNTKFHKVINCSVNLLSFDHNILRDKLLEFSNTHNE